MILADDFETQPIGSGGRLNLLDAVMQELTHVRRIYAHPWTDNGSGLCAHCGPPQLNEIHSEEMRRAAA